MLSKPEIWRKVAEAIGPHDYTYDLSDRSHRLDVVQIVCNAVEKAGYRIVGGDEEVGDGNVC